MKMTSLLLLLLCLFTINGYSQDDEEQQIETPSTTPFESSPFSSSRTYYSRCRYCGRYHAPSCNPTPTPAPIDGGLSLLLAAGTAYGVKRFRSRKGVAKPA